MTSFGTARSTSKELGLKSDGLMDSLKSMSLPNLDPDKGDSKLSRDVNGSVLDTDLKKELSIC